MTPEYETKSRACPLALAPQRWTASADWWMEASSHTGAPGATEGREDPSHPLQISKHRSYIDFVSFIYSYALTAGTIPDFFSSWRSLARLTCPSLLVTSSSFCSFVIFA